jgi:hypothetical protein
MAVRNFFGKLPVTQRRASSRGDKQLKSWVKSFSYQAFELLVTPSGRLT